MHPIHGILPLISDASHGRPGDGHGRAGVHLVTGAPKGKVAMGQKRTDIHLTGPHEALLCICVLPY